MKVIAMFSILLCLPVWVLAFTITTERKVGDNVCTSLDTQRHIVFSEQIKKEMQKDVLGPEDTLEGKALIQQFLTMNQLHLTAEEKDNLYLAHLARMQHDKETFEAYLESQGLSRQSYIDEIAYRQEVLRWMLQTYGWREHVTQTELATFKNTLLKEQALQSLVTFEVINLKDKQDIPKKMDEAFWEKNAQLVTTYREKTVSQIPEIYEPFVKIGKVGSFSPPIEAFGQWHIIRLLSKSDMQLPADDILTQHLLEKKCMAHLPQWVSDQLTRVYKG